MVPHFERSHSCIGPYKIIINLAMITNFVSKIKSITLVSRCFARSFTFVYFKATRHIPMWPVFYPVVCIVWAFSVSSKGFLDPNIQKNLFCMFKRGLSLYNRWFIKENQLNCVSFFKIRTDCTSVCERDAHRERNTHKEREIERKWEREREKREELINIIVSNFI